MSSLTSHMYNLVFRLMPQNGDDFEAERARNDRKPPRPPKGVQVTACTLNGLSAEKIEKPGNDRGWVIYIHGGGFTTGSARERRGLCQYIAAHFGYHWGD